MKIHHLNLGTMRPILGQFISGSTLICRSLLVEHGDRLILLDTGIGLRAIKQPKSTLGSLAYVGRPLLSKEETITEKLKDLGFSPNDITDVLLTHMDADHIGGLAELPNANIHVSSHEIDAATRPKFKVEFKRYNKTLWDHDPNWRSFPHKGDSWKGFSDVREILPEILSIPLPGHTRGHTGYCFNEELIHAGDAICRLEELSNTQSLGVNLYQRALEVNRSQRLRSLMMLQSFQGEVICTHHSDGETL